MNTFQNGASLRGDLNKETLDVAKGVYDLPTAVPLTPEPTSGENNSIRTLMGGGIRSYPNRTPGFACGKDAYRNGRDRIDNAHGEVHGPGTPTSDQVPAMLSDKEAVLNAGAVEHVKDQFGDDIIKKWNAEHKPAGAQTKVRGGILRAASGLDYKKLIEDTTGVTPNSQLGRGRPSFPNPALPGDATPKTPGTDLVPAGERMGSRYSRVGANDFTAEGVKSAPSQGFTVEPSTNPGGTMQANRALTPYSGDPWTAGSKSGDLASGLKSFGNKAAQFGKDAAKGIARGVANIASDPLTFIPAAYEANKFLLGKGLESGAPGVTEAFRAGVDKGVSVPAMLAEKLAGPVGEGPLSKVIGKVGESLASVPETVKAVRQPPKPDTAQAVTASMTTPENTSAAPTAAPKEAPSDPNIYGPGGVNFGTNPTQEQINQITGRTGKGIVPGGVDEYKRMLQAQGEFNDRERTQQEIAFRNYGTTFPGTQPAGRFADAYTPEELATRRYEADAELAAEQGRNDAYSQAAQAKQQAAQKALAGQGFNSYEMKAIRDATDPDEKVNKMGKAFIQQNFDDKTLERLLKIYPDLFSGFGVMNAQQ